jgi:ion channel POLLUX/CASTOR
MKHQPTFAQKSKYYFENTISAGPMGIIKWLSIISLVIVLFLGLIILVFGIKGDPEGTESLGFIEGSWKSLMATLDPGTMGGDEGWSFRMIRFLATLVGIFLISILIGIISSAIDEKIDELKKGKSQVLETNHTLILGWSEKIYSIISEIIEANENQKKPAIVVMSEMDKVEMEDEIRSHISDFKNTKIIVRSGNPLISQEIAIVNPNEARSIVVLSPEKENADTYVIKTVLAFTNGQNRKKEPYNIVAEIKDPNNMETAELVGNDEAVFVLSGDLISRITAQTCRQSGLSVVYTELLQFDGDEIYFSEEKKLVGKTYKDAIFAYETSTVIGIFTEAGDALINPTMDTVINQGDQIIAISEDDDTVIVSGKSSFDINTKLFSQEKEQEPQIDKTLILGWNEGATTIINELDEYVGAGSLITVVNEIEIEFDASELNNLKLNFVKGNTTNKKVLEDIKPETFDHIIVLSNPNIDIQESDAKTLICLLHLRNMSDKHNKDFSIVSEMKDLRNRELGVIAKADDFIVGDNIISLMMSQLSENKELKKVFDILFEADGSEIYLKPINRYITTDEETNFYTILERASELGESALGYRIFAQKEDAELHYGVKVNPKKSDTIKFCDDDFIIVLSED